jgi:hypothetical protein
MNTYANYRRGLTTYEVSYRRTNGNLIRAVRIMAEDDYAASLLVRDSLQDVTIIKVTQLT